MAVVSLLVIMHALAATVRAGGHLVLDLGLLPRQWLIPNLTDANLCGQAWHTRGITALAIASSRASTISPALSLGCRFNFTRRRMEEKRLRSGRAESTLLR